MRPYYQGKLDVFCAIYAVLNAFQKLHSISTWQAKRVLSETLVRLPAENAERWKECVANQTDYIWLVEELLEIYGLEIFPLRRVRPWHAAPRTSSEEVWAGMAEWMAGGTGRTGIFRFKRFMLLREEPLVCHWTTIDRIMGDVLFLFDASKEENAVHLIDSQSFVTARSHVCAGRLLQIEPESVFLLAPA